jgi:hypothetical protein
VVLGTVVLGTVVLGTLVLRAVVVGAAVEVAVGWLDPHADSAVARASVRAATTGLQVPVWIRKRLMAPLLGDSHFRSRAIGL